MNDLTRRGFLKVAGLSIASALGMGALSQEQEKKLEDKEDEELEDKEDEELEDKDPDYDDLFEENEELEETRVCPQCGALMYRQGRTWTCDNCGYSYVE